MVTNARTGLKSPPRARVQQEQVKRASELVQTEHVGVQSDTNVVPLQRFKRTMRI